MSEHSFEKIVNHVRTSGFVYQGSEIYNGLANAWDYGPLGVELKNNVKNLWWKRFVKEPINSSQYYAKIIKSFLSILQL